MATVELEVVIEAPIAAVYGALASGAQMSRWWDEQTEAEEGGSVVLEHNPGPEHGVVRLKVVQMIPNRCIEWECISEHPTTSPASAWTGTRFVWQLSERGVATVVRFRQVGYDERSPFFQANKSAWRSVLANLKKFVEARRHE